MKNNKRVTEDFERFRRMMLNFDAGLNKPFADFWIVDGELDVDFLIGEDVHPDNDEIRAAFVAYHKACEEIASLMNVDPRD